MKDAGTERARTRVVRIEISPRTMIAMVLVAAAAWALLRLLPVLLVLVAALILAGTVNPAVQWLQARRIQRGTSIAVVFFALFILTILIVTLTVPVLLSQATSLLEQEPMLRERLAAFLDNYVLTTAFAEYLRAIRYNTLAKSSAELAFAFSARIIEVFAYCMSAVFIALYLMIDRDRLRGWLFAIVPRAHHLRLSRIMLSLEIIVGSYMRGQLITSLLMAAFIFILLTAFGVQSALAIAVFGGIVDVLPYIGALLTMIPAVVAALPQGAFITLMVLMLMLAYEEFESRFLIPRVYGRTLRLPSAVVLFAILAGATLQGIVGAFLSLPVAAAALMLIEELRVKLPGEPGLMERTELHEWDDFSEREYQRRAGDLPAEQAAGIAVEISRAHRKRKGMPPRTADVESQADSTNEKN